MNSDDKLASAIAHVREAYKRHDMKRKERSIKIITYIPPPPPSTPLKSSVNRGTVHKCQATLLSGKPCSFRATSQCGRFCRKHNL